MEIKETWLSMAKWPMIISFVSLAIFGVSTACGASPWISWLIPGLLVASGLMAALELDYETLAAIWFGLTAISIELLFNLYQILSEIWQFSFGVAILICFVMGLLAALNITKAVCEKYLIYVGQIIIMILPVAVHFLP